MWKAIVTVLDLAAIAFNTAAVIHFAPLAWVDEGAHVSPNWNGWAAVGCALAIAHFGQNIAKRYAHSESCP